MSVPNVFLQHKKQLAAFTGGLLIGLLLVGTTSATLSIQTAITNARIVIQEILFSDDGLDTASNTKKIKIYADPVHNETLVVEGDLKVTNLQTLTNDVYVVTTDQDGVLSFLPVSSLNLSGGSSGGGSSGSGSKWLDSSSVSNSIYYNDHVGVGTDADTSYALHVRDTVNALRVGEGSVQIDDLGNRVGSNGPGVMTVDASGIISMSKVTNAMLSTSIGGGSGGGLWQDVGGAIYYSSGSVGVGTASPVVDFHVNGDTLTDRLYVLNGETTLTNMGNDAFWFAGTGKNIVIGSSDNNIGIGGVVPSSQLHVAGTTSIDSEVSDDSGLILVDLPYTAATGAVLADVGCKVLGVDVDGKVILIDANQACGNSPGGTQSYKASNTNAIKNGTNSVVLMDDMILSPPGGKYLIQFNASAFGDLSGTNFSYQIYVNGLPLPDSYREFTQADGATNSRNVIATQGIGSVDSTQDIEIRRANTGGSGVATVFERSLILIRVQ